MPIPPLFKVNFPALLPGSRIYTDDSCAPDLQQQTPRPAEIGIFLVNNHMQSALTHHIKAIMTSTTSVLMAESAGLALAASLAVAL
jgi:hypothetical protein